MPQKRVRDVIQRMLLNNSGSKFRGALKGKGRGGGMSGFYF